MKSYKQELKNFNNCLEYTEATEEIEAFISFKLGIIGKKEHPLNSYYEILSDVVRDSGVDEDTSYIEVSNCLEALEELKTLGELEEFDLYENASEPDCYTASLTAWLGKSNNLTWLDEALLNTDCREGYQLLAYAQQYAIQAIWQATLSAVINHLKD